MIRKSKISGAPALWMDVGQDRERSRFTVRVHSRHRGETGPPMECACGFFSNTDEAEWKTSKHIEQECDDQSPQFKVSFLRTGSDFDRDDCRMDDTGCDSRDYWLTGGHGPCGSNEGSVVLLCQRVAS